MTAYLEVAPVSKDEKRDLRYYAGAVVCAKLAKKSHPSPSEVAALVKQCVVQIDADILEFCADMAISVYKKLGATDKIAKSAAMRTDFLKELEGHFGI